MYIVNQITTTIETKIYRYIYTYTYTLKYLLLLENIRQIMHRKAKTFNRIIYDEPTPNT